MAEQPDLRSLLRSTKRQQAQSVQSASKLVKGVLILGGALLAGCAQFWTWAADGLPTASQIIGIAATVAVGIGGLYVLITEQDAAMALDVADRAMERAREVEGGADELRGFFESFERLSETYRVCLTWRGALEQAGVGVAGSLDDLIRTAFDIVARQLSIAAGFAQADRWTIGVYKAVQSSQPGKLELRCIAHKRALDCTLQEARVWPEGVGIAGIAFSGQREIIVPDLRAEGLRAVYGPLGHQRQYDTDRYVSMVAVPIMVQGRDKPWGVVNATTDKPNHFSGSTNPGFKTDEPIRAIAAFVALTVAMHDARSRATSAPPARSPAEPVAVASVSQGSIGAT